MNTSRRLDKLEDNLLALMGRRARLVERLFETRLLAMELQDELSAARAAAFSELNYTMEEELWTIRRRSIRDG